MAVSETSFNRKKVNYLARKRTKERQRREGHTPKTIDSKKARQMKLFARKQKKKEEKRKAKESKMEVSK